ncbi:MAG: hypothetical protein H6721_09680 [Sandaracinus sp.]|nr:hypothetical protein [Sandaracinus sp.]
MPLFLALGVWGWALANPPAEAPAPEPAPEPTPAPEPEVVEPPPPPPLILGVDAQPITLLDVDLRVAPLRGLEVAQVLAGEEAAAFNAAGGAPATSLPLATGHAEASHGALRPFCGVAVAATERPDWPERARVALEACRDSGARAVFVPRTVGLGVRREAGGLLSLAHESLDTLFDTAFASELVVVIEGPPPPSHFAPLQGNPDRAFLEAFPSDHFHGARTDGDAWPTHDAILAALESRVRRSGGPTLLLVAPGSIPSERLAGWLNELPGLHVAIDPRDEGAVALLTEHVGRVMLGSGAVVTPGGVRRRGSTEVEPGLEALAAEHAAIRAALEDLPPEASEAARTGAADTLLGPARP